MKKTYTVHSAHELPYTMMAKLEGGGEAEIKIAGFEVQLVPEDRRSGTIKVSFKGTEAAMAAALFAEGKTITVDFS